MKWTIAALLAVSCAIQFIPVDRRNPLVNPAQSIYQVEPVPAPVRQVFDSACNDCHSNQTRWPWYSRVAPVSWIIAHDVHDGRKHLNFSEWGAYSPQKRDHKLEELCDQLMNDDMPDAKYAFLHRRARLAHPQRELVCQWIDTGRATPNPH